MHNPWNLTVREFAVIALVAASATRREIGGELGIVEKTVKNTCLSAYRRMDVRNAVAATLAYCREYGIPETYRPVE